jgi:hypothetical protein
VARDSNISSKTIHDQFFHQGSKWDGQTHARDGQVWRRSLWMYSSLLASQLWMAHWVLVWWTVFELQVWNWTLISNWW